MLKQKKIEDGYDGYQRWISTMDINDGYQWWISLYIKIIQNPYDWIDDHNLPGEKEMMLYHDYGTQIFSQWLFFLKNNIDLEQNVMLDPD